MTNAPILLLGAAGQVGSELRRALAPLGPVVACGRGEVDLSRPDTIRLAVHTHRPRAVVNAAAYTAVDRAEREPALAHAVNAEAPGVIAEEAALVGACVVHYSTDYVFDGTKTAPYLEEDAPNPLSTYGRTKLAGERAVAAAGARHLVFRTSWVYAAHGANFLKTVLRLAGERDALRVVADQHGAPTGAALIADVTAYALAAALASDSGWGLYHLTAAGETTWNEYARHVVRRARQAGAPLRAVPEHVEAITTAEYPTPAARPLNSRLDTARLRGEFAVELPDWRRGIDDVLDRLLYRTA